MLLLLRNHRNQQGQDSGCRTRTPPRHHADRPTGQRPGQRQGVPPTMIGGGTSHFQAKHLSQISAQYPPTHHIQKFPKHSPSRTSFKLSKSGETPPLFLRFPRLTTLPCSNVLNSHRPGGYAPPCKGSTSHFWASRCQS